MSSRPQVSVISVKGEQGSSQLPLPAVFAAPVRPDLVHSVFVRVNKTRDKLTLSLKMPVTKPLLNHGVPVELLPEFQELVVVVLTVPVKLLLVTCVEVVVCLLQPRLEKMECQS